MYTLDTNAIIYYLKDDAEAVGKLHGIFVKGSTLYVSAITEVELFSFSDLGLQEIEKIESILGTVSVIPLDSRIARIAGSIRRSHKLRIPDAVVAATALFTGTTLLTRNISDFKKVPDFSVEKI